MFEKKDGVWTWEPSLQIKYPVQVFGYGVTSEEGAEKEIKRRSKEIADITAEGKLPTSSQVGILKAFVEGLMNFRGNIAESFDDAWGKMSVGDWDSITDEDEPKREPKPVWE